MANKPPKTTRSWIQNTSRSIGNLTKDIVTEVTPNFAGTARSASQVASESRQFLLKTKSSMVQQSNVMQRTPLGRKVKDMLTDAKEDIKSGNFSQTQYSAFASSHSDAIDPDEYDSAQLSGTDYSQQQLNAISSLNATIANTNSATISSIKSMTSTLANVQMKSSEALASSLENMNIAHTNILNNGMSQIVHQLEITNQYQAAMLKFMNENISPTNQNLLEIAPVMGDKLSQIADVLTELKNSQAYSNSSSGFPRSKRMDRVMTEGSGFDFQSYKGIIKENADNLGLGMALSLFGRGGGSRIKLAPTIAKMGLSAFLGSSKDKISSVDKNMAQMMRTVLYGLGDAKYNPSANFMQRALGNLLGIERSTVGKINLGVSRKEESMGWNGIAQKTLVEVIPSYLASMEAALNGTKTTRHYNHKSGTFMTDTELAKEFYTEHQEKLESSFAEFTQILQKVTAGMKESDASLLTSRFNSLADSRMRGDRRFDKAYKAEINEIFSSNGIGVDIARSLATAMERGIEGGIDAILERNESIQNDRGDYLAYRQLLNGSSSRMRNIGSSLTDRQMNPINMIQTNGLLLDPGTVGILQGVMGRFNNRKGGSFRSKVNEKISAVAGLSEDMLGHLIYDTKGSGSASSRATLQQKDRPNPNNDMLTKKMMDTIRTGSTDKSRSQIENDINTSNRMIEEGLRSGKPENAIQSMILSLHTNFLQPISSGIFGKEGLIGKYLGDNPDSLLNQFKEKLFGKEKGLLTPMLDYVKYKFTGKGYTSRKGITYEDTDKNVIANMKKAYSFAFNNSMHYIFGEKFRESDNYQKTLAMFSPEAFKERSDMRAERRRLSQQGQAVGYGRGQRDPRWAKYPLGRFKDGTIATMDTAGCGPTALAQMSAFLGNKRLSPMEVAQFAQMGGYIKNGGATSSLFTDGAAQLGMKGRKIGFSSVMQSLQRGKKVILSGKSANGTSVFSKDGHIITLLGANGREVSVYDPDTGETRILPIEALKSGAKSGWSYDAPVGYGKPKDTQDIENARWRAKQGYSLLNARPTKVSNGLNINSIGRDSSFRSSDSDFDGLLSLLNPYNVVSDRKSVVKKSSTTNEAGQIEILTARGNLFGTINTNGAFNEMIEKMIGRLDVLINTSESMQTLRNLTSGMTALSNTFTTVRDEIIELNSTFQALYDPEIIEELIDAIWVSNTIRDVSRQGLGMGTTETSKTPPPPERTNKEYREIKRKQKKEKKAFEKAVREEYRENRTRAEEGNFDIDTPFQAFMSSQFKQANANLREIIHELNGDNKISNEIDEILNGKKTTTTKSTSSKGMPSKAEVDLSSTISKAMDDSKVLKNIYSCVYWMNPASTTTTKDKVNITPSTFANQGEIVIHAKNVILNAENLAGMSSTSNSTSKAFGETESVMVERIVNEVMTRNAELSSGVIRLNGTAPTASEISNDSISANVLDHGIESGLNSGDETALKSLLKKKYDSQMGKGTFTGRQSKALKQVKSKANAAYVQMLENTLAGEASASIVNTATTQSIQNVVESAEALTDKAIGDPEKFDKSFKGKIDKFISQLKQDSSRLLTGATAGAVVGTLSGIGSGGLLTSLFLPGGPITGAIAGVGLSLLGKSQKFNDFVFGKEIDGKRSGGLISKDVMGSFKKALPFAVGGATLGVMKNLVFGGGGMPGPLGVVGNMLVGSGPIGAAIIGAGIGLLKNNETFMNRLFGKKEDGRRIGGLLSGGYNKISDGLKKSSGFVKGAFKGLGVGALAGTTIGQMGILGGALTIGGPIGTAIAGLGIGIASNTKRFQRLLFGTEDIDNDGKSTRNKDGLIHRAMAMMSQNLFYPMKGIIQDKLGDFAYWAANNIMDPFRLAFGPIIDTFKTVKQTITETIHAGFETITNGIAETLKVVVDKTVKPIFSGMKTMGKAMADVTGVAAKITGSFISAPLKMIAMTQAMKRHGVEKDFKEKYKGYRAKHLQEKWDYEDANNQFTGRFSGFKRGLSHIRDGLGIGTNVNDEVYNEIRAAYGEGLANTMGNSLGWFKVKGEKRLRKKEYTEEVEKRNKFREVEKELAKWAKQDKHNESKVWKDSLFKERRKTLEEMGIISAGVESEADIKQLMYHRGAWQKDYGKFGDKDPSKIEVAESPEAKEARIQTTDFQNKSIFWLQNICEAMVGFGEEYNYRKRGESEDKRTEKRYNRMRRNLSRLGIDESELLKSGLDVRDLSQMDTWEWSRYKDSKDGKNGDVENYIKKNYETIYEKQISSGEMPSTYTVYKKWSKQGRSRQEVSMYNEAYGKKDSSSKRADADVTIAQTVSEGLAKVSQATNNLVTIATGGDTNALDSAGNIKVAAANNANISQAESEAFQTKTLSSMQEFEKKQREYEAEAAKEAKEREEAQSLKDSGNVYSNDPSAVKIDSRKTFWDKLKSKEDGTDRGGFLGLVGSVGALFANSTVAKVIAGLGAVLFKDQIMAGAKFIGSVVPQILPFITNNLIPGIINVAGVVGNAIIDNIGAIAEGALGLMKNMAIGTVKGIGNLFGWAGEKLGISSKVTKYDSTAVDIVAGISNDGTNLAKYNGEFMLDPEGNYMSLGNRTYITSSGEIASVGTGLGGDLARYGYNAAMNPKLIKTGAHMVGYGLRGASAVLKHVPVAGNVFRATGALGKKMTKMSFEKTLGAAMQESGEKITSTGEKYMAKQAAQKAQAEILRNTAENTAREAAEEAVEATGRTVAAQGTEKIVKDKAHRFFGEAVDSLTKKASSIASVVKEGPFKKLCTNIATRMKAALEKLSSKGVGKWLARATGAVGKGFMKIAPIIGWAWQAYDAITGWAEAEYLFDVPSDQVDYTMKAVSAVMKWILGLGIGPVIDIIFTMIGEADGTDYKKEIAMYLYELLTSAMGDPNAIKQLKDKQDVMQIELDNYNEINGTNLSMSAYTDLKKKNNSWWNTAKSWLGFGNKEDFSKYKATEAQIAQAGIKSVTNGNTTINNITTFVTKSDDPYNQNTANTNTTAPTVGYGMAQTDPRWAKYPLGRFKDGSVATMDMAGCGPTALANVARGLTGKDVNPVQIAGMAKRNGMISEGGANASLFTSGAEALGLRSEKISPSSIISRLKNGDKIIVSGKTSKMSVGYGTGNSIFTKAGHIVSIEGAVGNNVLVNDPQSGLTTIKSVNELAPELTNAWALHKRNVGYGRANKYASKLQSLGFGNATIGAPPDNLQTGHDIYQLQKIGADTNSVTSLPKETLIEMNREYKYIVDMLSKNVPGYIAMDDRGKYLYQKGIYQYEDGYYPKKFEGVEYKKYTKYLKDGGKEKNVLQILVTDAYGTQHQVLVDKDKFDSNELVNGIKQKAGLKKVTKFNLKDFIIQNNPNLDASKYVYTKNGKITDNKDPRNLKSIAKFIEYANNQDKLNATRDPSDPAYYQGTFYDTLSHYVYSNPDQMLTVQDFFDIKEATAGDPTVGDKSFVYSYLYDQLKKHPEYYNSFTGRFIDDELLAKTGAADLINHAGAINLFANNPTGTSDCPYGIMNGIPFYNQMDERWKDLAWKRGTIGTNGDDITALAMILTAYATAAGTNKVISPQYIKENWMTDQHKAWFNDSGFTSTFFGKNGLQLLKETYGADNLPISIRQAANPNDALNAMKNKQLVLMRGLQYSNSPFGGIGAINEAKDQHTVVGTYSDGKMFSIVDPAKTNNAHLIFENDALSARDPRNNPVLDKAIIFSTSSGAGISNPPEMNSPISAVSAWDSILGSSAGEEFGAFKGFLGGFTKIIANLVDSLFGGTEYKSIFAEEFSDAQSGLDTSSNVSSYNNLNANSAVSWDTTAKQDYSAQMYANSAKATDPKMKKFFQDQAITGPQSFQQSAYSVFGSPLAAQIYTKTATTPIQAAFNNAFNATRTIAASTRQSAHDARVQSNRNSNQMISVGRGPDTKNLSSLRDYYGLDMSSYLLGRYTQGNGMLEDDGFIPSGTMSANGSKLGDYVKEFESGNSGPAFVSSGKGDAGGRSFGSYQFASYGKSQSSGNLAGFWNRYYRANWPGVTPGANDTFINAWQTEANRNPALFHDNEYRYVFDSYYRPFRNNNKSIVDPDRHSRSAQEASWSTAVQYGPNTNVFRSAFGGQNVQNTGVNALINTLQDFKVANIGKYFAKSSAAVQAGVRNRHQNGERNRLLSIANMPALSGIGGENDVIASSAGVSTSGIADIINGLTSITSKYVNEAFGGLDALGELDANSLLSGVKTNTGLIEFAKAMVAVGAQYIWGGSCKRFTLTEKERLIKAFKSKKPKSYYDGYYAKYKDRYVCDCSGLIQGYTGVDMTANSLYNSSTSKGTINSLPEILGVLVFVQNSNKNMEHVGIYIGNGKVIHAKGHDIGVVEENLSNKRWTHWGKIPSITYTYQAPAQNNIDSLVSKLNSSNIGYGSGNIVDTMASKSPVQYLMSTLGGRLTNDVGIKVDPVTGNIVRHRGTDIAAYENSPIYSPIAGTVVENRSASAGSDYGNFITIRDANGQKHLIAHMKNASRLSVGSQVSSGDVLGNVGSTGNSTGPHVHYEIRNKDNIVNPLGYGQGSKSDDFVKKVLGAKIGNGYTVGQTDFNMDYAKVPADATGGKDDILGVNKNTEVTVNNSGVENKLDELIHVMSSWAAVDASTKDKIIELAKTSASNNNVQVNYGSASPREQSNSSSKPRKSSASNSSNTNSDSGLSDMGLRSIHELIAKSKR